jgi:hypothetical protein
MQAVVCRDHRAPQEGIESSPVRAILIVYVGYVSPLGRNRPAGELCDSGGTESVDPGAGAGPMVPFHASPGAQRLEVRPTCQLTSLCLCGTGQSRCDRLVQVVEPEPRRHVVAHGAKDGGERHLVADASRGQQLGWLCLALVPSPIAPSGGTGADQAAPRRRPSRSPPASRRPWPVLGDTSPCGCIMARGSRGRRCAAGDRY